MDAHKQITLMAEELSKGEARGDDAESLAQGIVVPLIDLYLDSLKVEQALDLFNRYSRFFDQQQELSLTLKTGQVLTFGEGWDLSLKCFGRCAEICQETGADAMLAEVYGYMATAHRKMEEPDRAMELHLQQEQLGLQSGNLPQQAAGCAGQGVLWEESEEWEPAVAFLARALTMYRELDNKAAQAIVQARLARADYMDSHDAEMAVEMLRQSHVLCEEPEILCRVGETSYLLGVQLCADGAFELAMKVLKQAQRIQEKANDGAGVADTLLGMADVELGWGKRDEAMDHLGRARKLWEQVGDRAAEADTWGRMGMVNNRFDRPNAAIKCFGHAMQILDELGDREGLGPVYHAIGRIYLQHGAPDNAVTFLDRGISTMESMEEPDPGQLARARFDLALSYVEQKKDLAKALSLLEAARDQYLEMDDLDMAAEVVEKMDLVREEM